MDCAQACPVRGVDNLLLATDGSVFSEGAIREAINFAKKCSSRLLAVTILESNPEYETIGSKFFEREEKEVLKNLESVKARAAHEGVTCEIGVFRADDPAAAIVAEAVEKKMDMIIIGRRGRTGLKKLLMGETAAKVIGHAPCKVLVVPRAARIEYRDILVATDGSTHARAAVSEAIAIAKRCGSRLIALSAMRDENGRKEAEAHSDTAVESARQEGVPAEALTPMGRSFKVIVETAGGRGVDLIVMGTYGKTGVKKIFMGSATEKVIGAAGCAVLVVKATAVPEG
jgi:nucleotide-binding universal stress UspA family protein